MPITRAPVGMKASGRRLWKGVLSDYDLAPAELEILRAACEASDRAADAGVLIEGEGMIVAGRFGSRAHPAVAIERDSRLAMLRALRELGLDPEGAEKAGRPPLLRRRYA